MKRLIFAALAALVLLPASAMAKDRNDDGLPDRWEHEHGLSTQHQQGRRDQDHDGLRNRDEFEHHTGPRDPDTDDDGIDDGDEVDFGFHPRHEDKPGNAGTVKTFATDTGALTLSLLKGGELTATVTDATHLQCETSDDVTAETSDSGPSHEGSSDDGAADDDHGDRQADDQGGDDDNHGDDHGHHGHHGHHSAKCGAEALVAGAKVRRARLEIVDGEAVWTKLKIVG